MSDDKGSGLTRVVVRKSQSSQGAILSSVSWSEESRQVKPSLLHGSSLPGGRHSLKRQLVRKTAGRSIGVHVKTLRAAARDGRLPVTYDTQTTFRRLRARATPAAARAFRRSYYGRTVRPADHRTPFTWSTVPVDYDVRIRAVRRELGLSQARFAARVGAARKAVVYQWEARKRCPSPVFWTRIQKLAGTDSAESCPPHPLSS